MTDIWKDKKLLNQEYVKKKYHTQKKYLEEEPEIPDALPALKNKVIGLYFSASWCPPCQAFTPELKKIYDELQKRGSNFEIVFISFDKTEEDMISYFTEKHGNWLAVPFESDLTNDLRDKFDIRAVPKLVIIKDNGELITMKGRKDIQDKGVVCFRNWLELANIKDDSQAKNGDISKNHNINNSNNNTETKEIKDENEVKPIQNGQDIMDENNKPIQNGSLEVKNDDLQKDKTLEVANNEINS